MRMMVLPGSGKLGVTKLCGPAVLTGTARRANSREGPEYLQMPACPTAAQENTMRQSHVIDIGGVFVGAAVRETGAYRFIAVDPRVETLDRTIWAGLPEVERAVRHVLTTGRLPPH
jgi:hypothetical protein